jgi:sarcosine oxidase
MQLAKRGVRVLGLEQFGIPNAMGSSHGDTRMIRLCYYEHPDYVPLLRRAYELWDSLERESGEKLLYKTGGLYMGRAESEFLRGTIRSAREHGLPHERLSLAQVRERYPQFALDAGMEAVFEPEAGFLLPERVVSVQAELAMRHGAELHANERVIEWEASGNGVKVRSERGTYFAKQLILCAGAWTEEVARELGVYLQVTRQPLMWVWPKKPELFELGRLPVWAIDHEDDTQHYGFPMVRGMRPGFKIAHHFHGEVMRSADALDRTIRADEEADIRWVLEKFIPEANGVTTAMTVCMYTTSEDSHFVIDRHPKHAEVLVACGFSGHGFKFASVMGEVIADLVEKGETKLPVGFLGVGRLKE